MASKYGGIAVDQAPASKYGGVPVAPAQSAGPREYAQSMMGPIEGGIQMLSATVAEPIAGLAGIMAQLIPGGKSGGDMVRDTQSAMTYQPRTQAGKQFLPDLMESVINATPEIIKRPLSAAGQTYSELERSIADQYGPAAGAALAALPTAILEAIPAGLAMREMRAASVPEPINKVVPEAPPMAATSPLAPQTQVPVIPTGPEPIKPQYEQIASEFKTGQAAKIAPEVKPDMQILDDAKALGIDLNPASYSTNRAYIDMEQALKSRPGSLLSSVEEKSIVDLGNRADQLIADLGGAPDRSILDSSLKGEFNTVIKGLEDQSDALYKKVDERIPRATRVDPAATKEWITQQVDDLGGDVKRLTAAERDLLDLTKDNPTYAALDRVRRDIGSAIGKRTGSYKEDDVGQLKNIYAKLLEDQQKFAEAFGVGDDYKDASALVKKRKQIEDQSIALFGKDVQGSLIPKIRQAATGLSRGDVANLERMMESVPENRRQEVAANLLNDIFTFGGRRTTAIGQGFAAAYQGLNRNKGAKDLLFKYLPADAQERFDRIGRVATGIYKSKALENNSRTARDVLAAMDEGGMFTKLYGITKRVAAAEGASSAMGMPGAGTVGVAVGSIMTKGAEAAKKADELLSSPAFRDAVTDYAIGATDKAQRRVSNTPEYNAWLRAQNPSVRAEVASIGLIPWLTSQGEASKQEGRPK